MRHERPSRTAAWVAGQRALGALLPPDARLIDDPFSAMFASPLTAEVARRARDMPRAAALARPIHRFLLSIQLRTRILDDVLTRFVQGGGRQVVLLGAGFDMRAARFRELLRDGAVFEVDREIPQAHKRRVLSASGVKSARVAYLACDLVKEPVAALPARLRALGHDPERPTLTLAEGLTMYLTAEAADALFAAIRAFSAPRSVVAFDYAERAYLDGKSPVRRAALRLLERLAEPLRYGVRPEALPGWLEARGFELLCDETWAALAEQLLPARRARAVRTRGMHIAVASRRDAG